MEPWNSMEINIHSTNRYLEHFRWWMCCYKQYRSFHFLHQSFAEWNRYVYSHGSRSKLTWVFANRQIFTFFLSRKEWCRRVCLQTPNHVSFAKMSQLDVWMPIRLHHSFLLKYNNNNKYLRTCKYTIKFTTWGQWVYVMIPLSERLSKKWNGPVYLNSNNVVSSTETLSHTRWPLSWQCEIPWRFAALLRDTRHVKCYWHHVCTSVTVSGGDRNAKVHDPKPYT